MTKEKSTVELRTKFYQDIDAGELDLSQTLKRMRKIVKMNQVEFAELVDVAPGVIRAIEQRRGNPTLESLEKIGRPFALTLGFRRAPFISGESSRRLADIGGSESQFKQSPRRRARRN